MRTPQECVLKASEMNARATQAPEPADAEEFYKLALGWLLLARRAERQDEMKQLLARGDQN